VDFFLQPLNLMFTALAIGSGLLLILPLFTARGVSRLSTTQASALINARAQVVDVREVEAFASGHIKNSKSLPFAQITQQLPLIKLKKDKPVLIVCDRGSVATRAASMFAKNEFTDVHILEGGLKGWRDAQLPLVKD
jgi:rhodanese-related sulfurtransferase